MAELTLDMKERLDREGVLEMLKLQLRTLVMDVLTKKQLTQGFHPGLTNEDMEESVERKTSLLVAKELLDRLGLTQSARMLVLETGLALDYVSSKHLLETVNINTDDDFETSHEEPVLVQMIAHLACRPPIEMMTLPAPPHTNPVPPPAQERFVPQRVVHEVLDEDDIVEEEVMDIVDEEEGDKYDGKEELDQEEEQDDRDLCKKNQEELEEEEVEEALFSRQTDSSKILGGIKKASSSSTDDADEPVGLSTQSTSFLTSSSKMYPRKVDEVDGLQ